MNRIVLLIGLCIAVACRPGSGGSGQHSPSTEQAVVTANVPTEERIDPTQVGGISLGATLEQLKSTRGSGRLEGDMTSGRYAWINAEGQTELELSLDTDGRVERIRVLVPRYSTALGMGVGDSLGRLMKAYPTLELERSVKGMAALHPEQGFRFWLDLSALRAEQADVDRLDQLPKELVVYAVELARADSY